MLHLPLWHSFILAHRLCKPAASHFLNFPDPKWEIRFLLVHKTMVWESLLQSGQLTWLLAGGKALVILGVGVLSYLISPYFVLAWEVEDGDHWGQGSLALSLLSPDLCSPLPLLFLWMKIQLVKFS